MARGGVCAVALLFCCLSGCAGLVEPLHRQTLAVSAATAAGTPVAGLACVLRNDQGEWHVTTPGRVAVRRSKQPLGVRCKDAQWQTVPGASTSVAAGPLFLVGALLGSGVAYVGSNADAAHHHPDAIVVRVEPRPAAAR